MPTPPIPLDEIRENFSLLDDWEDRYRYVIELGRMLPPLDDALKTDANKVRGCASQVWLIARPYSDSGDNRTPARIAFLGDSDAHIVRGLVAILLAVVNGKTADEILTQSPQAVFNELGLKEHLTPQRSNGLASMIARVAQDARALKAQG